MKLEVHCGNTAGALVDWPGAEDAKVATEMRAIIQEGLAVRHATGERRAAVVVAMRLEDGSVALGVLTAPLVFALAHAVRQECPWAEKEFENEVTNIVERGRGEAAGE